MIPKNPVTLKALHVYKHFIVPTFVIKWLTARIPKEITNTIATYLIFI